MNIKEDINKKQKRAETPGRGKISIKGLGRKNTKEGNILLFAEREPDNLMAAA